MRNNTLRLALVALAGVLAAPVVNAAATFTIINTNAPGVGFNDLSPRAPVGGNTGTTLGEQRINAFVHAVSKWADTLDSSVDIVMDAAFVAQTCTPTGAVLGSAGAITVHADFANAPLPNTWYSSALANKRSGVDQDTRPGPAGADLRARFNINLGQPGCLDGVPFYLGLDNNHGPLIDFVAVLTHEMGHGLGFQTFTGSGGTGATLAGLGVPSAWDHFMLDETQGLTWANMTDAQRAASTVNTRKLVWTGAAVTAAAPGVLSFGVPALIVGGPAAGAASGQYVVGQATFGRPLSAGATTGDIMPISQVTAATGDGCTPFGAADRLAANGNIVIVNRGVCGFIVKAANAQAAGARGLIVADNVAGSPPPDLGGADPAITIPAVRVTLADGQRIRAALTKRSRTKSGVSATLTVNLSQLAGASTSGFVQLFTPNPYQQGSSLSHYDTGASRNLLMEPAINPDLTHEVTPPFDLTFPLFQDIGW